MENQGKGSALAILVQFTFSQVDRTFAPLGSDTAGRGLGWSVPIAALDLSVLAEHGELEIPAGAR